MSILNILTFLMALVLVVHLVLGFTAFISLVFAGIIGLVFVLIYAFSISRTLPS